MGVGVGSRELYKAAKLLGFDGPSGVELVYEEIYGLVGNEEWANEGRGWAEPGTTPWIPEDMASASIGQSIVEITPLQLARAYSVFANGGYLVTPHLADQGQDWTAPPLRTKVEMKPSTLETIRAGLRKVVADGTGYGLNDPALPPELARPEPQKTANGEAPTTLGLVVSLPTTTRNRGGCLCQNTPGGGSVHALPMAKKCSWPGIRRNPTNRWVQAAVVRLVSRTWR